MSTKHFVNDTKELVEDALESLSYQHPGLELDRDQKIVYSRSHNGQTTVSIISGGGAGHEPSSAAYVGSGMLSAAISGNIFASPSVKQICSCIRRVHGAAGVLLLVLNYTGDLLNFHQAAEKLRAEHGYRIEIVVVGDDVSLSRHKTERIGRRGLAGMVLVHKVLGALSQSGASLDKCLEVAKKLTSGLSTIAASLNHVSIPGQQTEDAIILGQDEIELGMGIHNEPGAQLLSPQPSLETLVDMMLDRILDSSNPDYGYVEYSAADDIVLLVNNLGSISVLEINCISTKVTKQLEARGMAPQRVMTGTFMSSLDGPGFSITLLKADSGVISHLEAATDALGWPVPLITPETWPERDRLVSSDPPETVRVPFTSNGSYAKVNPLHVKRAVKGACQRAIKEVPTITRQDTIVGDGDCGTTLERGCRAVLQIYEDASLLQEFNALNHIKRIATAVEQSMDGTSGALYSLFFNGLASGLRDLDTTEPMTIKDWAYAAREGLNFVQKATPARRGDRTLMDALEPFIAALDSGLDEAVSAGRRGASATLGLGPRLGRSSYVDPKCWAQVPDPGATGVAALIEGLAEGVRELEAVDG